MCRLRVHASVYTLVILNVASAERLWISLVTGAPSSSPDTGLETTAVTSSPDLFLGAPFLIPVESGGRTLAGILVSASPDSLSPQIAGGPHFLTFT